jgi:hypothetical protein
MSVAKKLLGLRRGQSGRPPWIMNVEAVKAPGGIHAESQ